MDQQVITDICRRFNEIMASRRSAAGNDNAGRSLSSIQQHPFYQQILSLARHTEKYEKPGLLDEALDTIDLGVIYAEADTASENDKSLGYQDHVIKALLRWFKEDFFKWVNAPACGQCGGETDGLGSTNPSSAESTKGASRTELYRCKVDPAHIERFPRYDDPRTLLTWRKGRCGEWANCFTLLCLVLGSRARWVWNAEDHVWTEVYSAHLKRWVHCDSCENAWDSPLIYSVGWGKKMSYCFAFSSTGAQDVTRRYVRSEDKALPRNKAPEAVVQAAIAAATELRRSGLSEDERAEYRAEDDAEELELAAYVNKEEPTKTAEELPRESGDAEWKRTRGEDGRQ